MPDIRDLLSKGATSTSRRPKLESAWVAGRRRLWTGRLLSVVLVFAVAASGVLGATSLLDSRDPEPPADDKQSFAPATLEEQAAIFAIDALDSIDLRSQNGLYANYRLTESIGDDRWRVEFSGPMDCSHELVTSTTTTRDFKGARDEEIDETRFEDWGCRSLYDDPILLEVSLREGVFSIADLTGPGRAELYEGPGRSDEAAPNHLLSFTQPQRSEPPAFELSDIEFVTDTESTIVHGSFLWTGRGRDGVFQTCEMTLLSAGGEELTSYPWDGQFSNFEWFPRSERKWEHDEVEAGGLSPDSSRDGFFHDSARGKFEDATDLELDCEPDDFSDEGNEDQPEDDPCTFEVGECLDVGGALGTTLVDVNETLWVGPVRADEEAAMAPVDEEGLALGSGVPVDGFVAGAAAHGSSLWVLFNREGGFEKSDAELVEIDTESREVVGEPIRFKDVGNIGEPSIAVDDDYVFVSVGEGLVHRVARLDRGVETFELGPHFRRHTEDNGPLYLAAGETTLWAAHGFGEIASFEPSTMEPTGVSAALGPNVNGIALAAGRVWTSGQRARGGSTVESVNVQTGERGEPIALPDGPVGAPTFSGDRVLVVMSSMNVNATTSVIQIDPARGAIVGEPLDGPPAFEPGAVLTDAGVWMFDDLSGSLYLLERP